MLAVLCCCATAGHEVEPCCRVFFIHPLLTTRSTAGWVSAGIPRHARPPRPCAAPPSSPAGCSAVGASALPSPALCSAPSPNRGAARIAPAGSFSLRPSDWVSAGSSLRPFFSKHMAHHAREEIREGRETVCAPEIVPAVLCCCSFFFLIRDRVCVALPFVAASSSTPSKDEVVAEPFQAAATTFVIKSPYRCHRLFRRWRHSPPVFVKQALDPPPRLQPLSRGHRRQCS